MSKELIVLLIPFLAGLIVWLLEKAKIAVNKRKIEEILHILYEIIFEVERKLLSGKDKINAAIMMAEKKLSDEQIKLLEKEKGSIGNAIQEVFEKYAQPVIVGKQIVEMIKGLVRKTEKGSDED